MSYAPALLLNATYEPLKIIAWQKAIRLLCQGKVEVVEEYEQEIRSISITFKLPAVLRLLRFIKVKPPARWVKFSRANIYARDDHRCQYCGQKYSTEDLTFDHVIPVSLGGEKRWENIVTCCIECNRKKGGRTPSQSGMKLVRKPERPGWLPRVTVKLSIHSTPECWRDYLYWNIELDSDY
ncbi:MAG: HNH endonuclease [Acidobacteriota bacterium]